MTNIDSAAKGAEDFLKFMENFARRALSPAVNMDPSEKAALCRHFPTLRIAYDGLAERVADHDGYWNLQALMTASFVIGSLTSRSKSARNALLPIIKRAIAPKIKKETMANQGLIANKANVTRAAERNLVLDKAIVAETEAKNRTMATSIEYASVIRPKVIGRLRLKPDTKWPSASHIKNRISAIKAAKA